MNKDGLVECKRCGGNACYEQYINSPTQEESNKFSEIITWLCIGCGFTTSTLMKEGSSVDRQAQESLPELYKHLRHVDSDSHVWYPSTVSVPNVGMVFMDGTNRNDWMWSAVRAVPILEEERKDKNFPKDQTHKMDMKNRSLHAKTEFIIAMAEAGLLGEE